MQTNMEAASSMGSVPTMTGRERRAQERVMARFDVRFARAEDAARAMRAFSTSVSAGGLCLRTQRTYEPGAAVQVLMEVARETFELSGVIAWTREDFEDPGVHYVGVRFVDVSAVDQQDLKELLQSAQR